MRALVEQGEITLPKGSTGTGTGATRTRFAPPSGSPCSSLVLLTNLLLHFLHFGRLGPSLIVFLGIPVAMSGGFMMLDLYGAYLTVAVGGLHRRDGDRRGRRHRDRHYIRQVMIERRKPTTVGEVRAAVLEAGQKRIRPALMTSVTTILALIPIFLTSGRGSDVMRPMAVPSIGGMIVACVAWFVVPMAYSALEERRVRRLEDRRIPRLDEGEA